jgi:two-component system cell cycle response regulator DivK
VEHPARVLVVEDNELNRKLVRDVLRHAGFDVLEARTGEDGVALAATGDPDVVLMDLQLPGIDGVEALRRIRSSEEVRRVPVIAVTAYAMSGDHERALRAGFDDYVTKPISARDLAQQVRDLVDREQRDG